MTTTPPGQPAPPLVADPNSFVGYSPAPGRPQIDTAAMAETRLPNVRVALDRQVDVITDTARAAEELDTLLGLLEDRLAAVLLPPAPIPGRPEPALTAQVEAPVICGLASEVITRTGMLRDTNDRLGAHGRRIMAIIERIDV